MPKSLFFAMNTHSLWAYYHFEKANHAHQEAIGFKCDTYKAAIYLPKKAAIACKNETFRGWLYFLFVIAISLHITSMFENKCVFE